MVYSHGFEEIYALEKVDVKSIRKLSKEEKKPAPKPVKKREKKKTQLHLNLGDSFQQVLPSFVLTEPIHQIGFARHLEAWLISRSIHTVEALIGASLVDLPDEHHQEISEKLRAYINDRPLDDTRLVDYIAWLRGLLGADEPQRQFIFLQQWGLEEILRLQPNERVEVRREIEERNNKWRREQKELLRAKTAIFSKGVRQVSEVLVCPWISERGGLASRLELSEYLIAIAEESESAKSVIALFSSVFCDGAFLLDRYLFHADEKLYCSDEGVADSYDAVVDRALSYFYNDNLSYELDQLESLLYREMAHEWRGFPDGFVKKVLRMSPQFYVRRDENQKLIIRVK